MRKLFSKWVPRLLTPDQKQQRVEDLERCLELFKQGKKDFLHWYETMDETLIHHCTPETKRSSTGWIAAGENRLKRPKTQHWAGNVMASVFWDAHGIFFIDYLEKGKTIDSDYYMALLDRLSAENKKKRSHMQKKKVLLHQTKKIEKLEKRWNECKGFSNRDITISYLYMNAPLNFFNELSMSKR